MDGHDVDDRTVRSVRWDQVLRPYFGEQPVGEVEAAVQPVRPAVPGRVLEPFLEPAEDGVPLSVLVADEKPGTDEVLPGVGEPVGHGLVKAVFRNVFQILQAFPAVREEGAVALEGVQENPDIFFLQEGRVADQGCRPALYHVEGSDAALP